MNTIQTIIETLARQEGLTYQEVYREMQAAIEEAYQNPEHRAAWRFYGFTEKPTVEAFLTILALRLGT